jgi:CubicO group peptidase (beta-lactamase class C family)
MIRRRSFYLMTGAAGAGLHGRDSNAQGGHKFETIAKQFMRVHKVPGLSVAFASHGLMRKRAAFGLANLRAQTPLTTDYQFRIASVSKPITAAAILKLVEAGKLTLGEHVFGSRGILKHSGPEGITVQHLLNHTAGGWSKKGKCPMFQQLEMNHQELIEWTLREYPLSQAPGTSYSYSNFGYCLLGRVIEAKSRSLYEAYVKGAVLIPSGAQSMHLGSNRPGKDEVQYYENGKSVEFPMQVHRMDSHGGWVGTPTDLVRFGLKVDGFPNPPI